MRLSDYLDRGIIVTFSAGNDVPMSLDLPNPTSAAQRR